MRRAASVCLTTAAVHGRSPGTPYSIGFRLFPPFLVAKQQRKREKLSVCVRILNIDRLDLETDTGETN